MTIETLQHPAGGPPPAPAVTTLHRDTSSDKNELGLYALIAGIITIVVFLVVGYRYFYVRQQISSYQASVAAAQQQYQTLQPIEAKVTEIKQVGDALSAAYQSQLSYTTLLKRLEATTYSSARYDSLSLTSKGQVVLNGKVSSYFDFAKTVKSFKEKDAQGQTLTDDVTINSVGQTQADLGGGAKQSLTTFSITFALKPADLKAAIAHPATTATSTTATSATTTTAPSITPTTTTSLPAPSITGGTSL